MKIKYFLILIILLTSPIIASNEADNWFFGDFCGIRFVGQDKAPVFVPGSQMSTDEGCATISDIKGNLLFYTDGMTIWNNQHVQMPNGSGLLGHSSATQSAVIVLKPGSDNQYYVFTVDRQASFNGFKYSVVDITKDLGRGDVAEKNIGLYSKVTEKITAVKHANGKDIWIIVHEWNSNVFVAFLLTENGIESNPVKSTTGTIHNGDNMNTLGYMKASPDGKHIALCIYYNPGIVEVLNFNNSTGELSNPLTLNSPDYESCYGVEFSPDGSKFYFSVSYEISRIYQLDLMAGSEQAIRNSIKIIAEFGLPYYYMALQYAPDNKIYIAKRGKSYLSAIEKPNENGNSCGFKEVAFDLQGRICRQGLPSFNQSYRDIYLNIQGNRKLCVGDSLTLKARVSDSVSYSWNGPDNFYSTDSIIIIPNISKSQEGYYKVTVTLGSIIKTDSVFIEVFEKPDIVIAQGDTAYICSGSTIDLFAQFSSDVKEIIWNTGETTLSIIVTKSGNYSVVAVNLNGCSDTASVTVIEKPLPVFNLLKLGPQKICYGETIEIYPDRNFLNYQWSNGENTERIEVDQPGEYFLIATDEFGCKAIDTIFIEGYNISVISPKDYDFEEVLVGSSSSKTLEFTNAGKDSIYISSLRRIYNSPEFKVTTIPGLPVWLKEGEKLTINITFTPDDINVYLDSIEIITAFPCNLFNTFQISGISGSDLTLISLPDTSGRVGSRFNIPIYAQLFSKNEFEISGTGKISFDASIFLPDQNQPIIISNQILNGNRVLDLQFPIVKVNRDKSIIGFISGTILLSSGIKELKIESFEWGITAIERDLKNGSFQATGICMPDISKIIRLENAELKFYPNPAVDEINIEIINDTELFKIQRIKIVSISGNDNFEFKFSGTNTKESVDIRFLSQGYYLIEIITNGGKFSNSFIKLK